MAAQFFGRVHHFKKALREFQFLNDRDVLALRVSENYPKLSFVYREDKFHRYHSLQFNDNMEDFVVKKVTEN